MSATRSTVSMQALAPVLEQTLLSGGSAEITVTGRSMLPLLLDRVSTVRLVSAASPRRGDILLYRRTDGTFVLHRLLRRKRDGTCILCGDAQTVCESGIRPEQLLGKVITFTRKTAAVSCTNPLYILWWNLHLLGRPSRHALRRLRGHLFAHARKPR